MNAYCRPELNGLRKVFLGCLVGALFLGCPPSRANSPSGDLSNLIESEPVLTLTLEEAVVRTLDHNLDITVSKQERAVRMTDILFEQAKFDPTVTLSGRYDRAVSPLNRPVFGFAGGADGMEPDNFDQNDTRVSMGMAQKLPSGR